MHICCLFTNTELATAHNYFTSEVNADSKPNITNTNLLNVNKLDLRVENTCDVQFRIAVYSASDMLYVTKSSTCH